MNSKIIIFGPGLVRNIIQICDENRALPPAAAPRLTRFGAAPALEIEAASLDAGVPRRDEHLKSADFFDVAQYPAITLKSTRVEVAGLDRA